MNHLVYFLSTTVFRVGSIALLYSYMNNYVALFIAIFWLANLFYGYKELAPVGAPYWLISLTSIFIPVYFIENTNNKHNIYIRGPMARGNALKIWRDLF